MAPRRGAGEGSDGQNVTSVCGQGFLVARWLGSNSKHHRVEKARWKWYPSCDPALDVTQGHKFCSVEVGD